MESMERIDVLKGIEKILVDKAYETGHISHRADGDWQKQADGSWIPYTGQSAQSTSQTQEPAPTEFSDLDKYIAKLPSTDLAEDSDEVTNVVAEYLADHGIDDNDDDFIAVRSAIMEKLNGDRYGEITEEDLTETPNDTIYSTEDITATTIDGEDAYEIAGTPVVAMKDPMGKWQVMDGDKIVADGLNTALAHETMVKTMNDKYGFGDGGDDGGSGDTPEWDTSYFVSDYKDLPQPLQEDIQDIARAYQSRWKGAGMPKGWWDKPIEDIADNLWASYKGKRNGADFLKKFGKIGNDEEKARGRRYIEWFKDYDDKNTSYVDKSYRDMRSVPATKNMGF